MRVVRNTLFFMLLLAIFPQSHLTAAEPAAAPPAEEPSGHGVVHTILMYVPNRVFDVLDPIRLRLRVGPGIAAGVRVTEAGAIYLGSYVSIWAGLPGPRQEPSLPIPAGLESLNGAQLSLADATTGGGIGPDYSPTEIGFTLHPVILGIDLELDPIEVLDLAVGLIGFDLRNDDL